MITFNIRNVKGLKRNLRAYQARVEGNSAKANAKTAVEMLTDIRKTLQTATPPRQFGADTGDLAGRYHVEVITAGGKQHIGGQNGAPKELLSGKHSDPRSALVGAVSDHVLPVEFGRRAGAKPPPPGALADWLRRHGLPESMEYVVAQSIARRGIQALPHMHPAIERARRRHLKNQKEALKQAGEEARR